MVIMLIMGIVVFALGIIGNIYYRRIEADVKLIFLGIVPTIFGGCLIFLALTVLLT